MKENALPWINPIGGLGDTLMLSGVLKQAFDLDNTKKYNLVRRKKYTNILNGHPAIENIGFPPENAEIIKTDYWSMEKLGGDNQRAYQILARAFGLKTPVKEELFYPGDQLESDIIYDLIPWKSRNILLSPTSESPRKELHPMIWHEVVKKLTDLDYLVLQVGKKNELHIKNTYSLIGITTIDQLIALIKKTDLVITVDNFIMHIAHMVGTPAVVIWGPTEKEVYGYPEQNHVEAVLDHCPYKNECLGPSFPQNYNIPCPLEKDHCINKITPETVYKKCINILS